MNKALAMVLAAWSFVQSASAFEVVFKDPATVNFAWTEPARTTTFAFVSSQAALQEYSRRTDTRVGLFPAVVDVPSRRWVQIVGTNFHAAAADLEARLASVGSADQLAKSPSLKAAENSAIKFLRSEGAIGPAATSVTADEIDAMYATWEATLNDTQLEKKSTKYTRLLDRVERRGGTELEMRYHE